MQHATIDAHGNILLPKWFLGFLSVVVTIITIAVVPWATSLARDLGSLSNEITGLRTQFDARATLHDEVVRNINWRIERIEMKLDRLEQRQQTDAAGHNTD